MIQFWHRIDCHVLCVMVFTIACKYLRLHKLMYKAPPVEMDFITSMFIVYRYGSTTGIFTVPPGGDGFYFFSVYLLVQADEYGIFDIRFNGDIICEAYSEQDDTTTDDEATTSCSAVASVAEGKEFINDMMTRTSYRQLRSVRFYFHIVLRETRIPLQTSNSEYFILICISIAGDTVQVGYRDGTDTTPLREAPDSYYSGFTGFRI